MNYISKRIEKKTYINCFNSFFIILKRKKFFLFYDIYNFYFKNNNIFILKNSIFIFKKYLIESGLNF